MRVLLDANVFVSALLSRRGAPARLVERWLDGELEVVVCETLVAEVERTLAYPKIRARLDADVAAEFVRTLRELGDPVPDPTEPPPLRSIDPADDYLLALATRERVALVTGDRDLLELADRAPIFTPAEFVATLA